MAYKALRNLSAGRDEKGNLVRFEVGKTYEKVPENIKAYFQKVEKAEKADSK